MPIANRLNSNGVPMECQLTGNLLLIDIQSNANWQYIECQLTSSLMPSDFQSNSNRIPTKYLLTTNWMSIDYQWSVHWFISDLKWTNPFGDEPIHCHLMSKTLDWHMFKIVRVPPLEIFWLTSRPMRSQHFELSTNEKPRFLQDSRCLPDMDSANRMPMCKLTVNCLVLHWDSFI